MVSSPHATYEPTDHTAIAPIPTMDARLYQIGFLSLFLLLGLTTRDWNLNPLMVGVAIATCCLTQLIAETLQQVISPSEPLSQGLSQGVSQGVSQSLLQRLRSPVITALGLSLLLRVNHPGTMVLAGIAAIASKFLLRIDGKHWFNPANFGIVTVLLLRSDAWVSPGQWGEESWYALVFLAAGGFIVQQVGRWETTGVFLGVYASLEGVRNVWLGWTWDVWAHRLMSGSLLLFALFMITDPRSIPNARTARILWASAIALVAFGLRNVWFIPTAVFWALFGLSPLTVLLDRIFTGDRFTWRPTPSISSGEQS